MTRVLLALAIALTPAVAFAQAKPAAALRGRVGFEDRLESASTVLTALDRQRIVPADLRVFVRLSVQWASLERASAGEWSALDERINAYARRSIPVLLAIEPRAAGPDAGDRWVTVIQSVAKHLSGRVTGYQIEKPSASFDPAQYAFLLKVASVQIRAVDARAAIAQATVRPEDAQWLTSIYAEGAAPYVDIAPIAAPRDVDAGIEAAIAAGDPSASRLQIGVSLGDTPAQSVERLLVGVLAEMGKPDVLGSTFTGSVEVLGSALSAAAGLKDLLAGDLIAMDDLSVQLAIQADGRDVSSTWPHRVYYDLSNGNTYLAYWGGDAPRGLVTFSIVDQNGRRPVVRDPSTRDSSEVQNFARDDTRKISRITTRASRTPLVLDFNAGAPNVFIANSGVSAAASLSVEEIVAENQQAQTANANAFQRYIASLRIQLHFRPGPTQVFDVISENRFFFARDSVEWEEVSFSVNGAKFGPDRPGLPLLQGEKVISLPLDLRLTSDYRYTLEGTETVGEHQCYVVAFEPRDATKSSYRGRVWIDTASFLRFKLLTIQTNLEGPIVSNEEITTFESVPSEQGGAILVPTRLSTKQILLVAGRNLLLEKEQWFEGFRFDPPEFEPERQAARASRNLMFRDTTAGVRYLVTRAGERVVSNDLRTSSKAIAIGTTIDPSFAFPLPIFGIDYLNFDVKGSGNQLAILFGGVFIAGNLQNPKLGKTPFDLSVDFFGIAVPGTDLRYDAAGERVGERVLTVPMSTGVNLGYQFTPFQKVSTSYSLRYDAFFRAPDTAEDFVVPASTATHGASVGYEYSRHGYRVGGGVAVFRRQTWTPWGPADDLQQAGQVYRRHSIGAAKDFLFGPFQSVHAGGGWYGGSGLDRFSMYQFGLFDELHMHGVPSAGIRFSELAMLRGSYSFNVFGIYRLDVFVDHARGREPDQPDLWHSITGSGVSVTFKTPFNTMFTADVGKSWIPDLYRGTGSTVLQFLILKPLR